MGLAGRVKQMWVHRAEAQAGCFGEAAAMRRGHATKYIMDEELAPCSWGVRIRAGQRGFVAGTPVSAYLRASKGADGGSRGAPCTCWRSKYLQAFRELSACASRA